MKYDDIGTHFSTLLVNGQIKLSNLIVITGIAHMWVRGISHVTSLKPN